MLMPGRAARTPPLAERERAEMARSASEARHTADAQLRVSEQQMLRYLDPPRDSPFPQEYLFALVGRIAGLTVLDLGCGSGHKTPYLVRRGARVIGVDLSPNLIALARRRLMIAGDAARATLLVGSAHQLPLADASIDLVFGYAVLHHLDLALARAELHRVLKPGGRALFHEPVRNSRLYHMVRQLVPMRHEDISPYEGPLRDADIDYLAARFRLGAMRAFALPPVRLAHVLPVLKRHLHPVYRLDRRLLRAVPALDRYAAIRVFELIK